MKTPIYLDYAATTPVAPEVIEVMAQCMGLEGKFGNPASRSHVFGWQAEEVVETARQNLAALIHADAREIIWTSGATESNNLAIKGAVDHWRRTQSQANADSPDACPHVITTQIEHKSVLDTCAFLADEGVRVSYIAPQADGRVAAADVIAAVTPNTVIISVMHANNEIGVINDIATVGEYCRTHDILFHVDAAQTVGKIPVDVKAVCADLLSISAHKFYGPKGIGALYVRRHPQVKIAAQIHGGGHERGMRSGTLPTHQIAGFGKAAELAISQLDESAERLFALRERFIDGLAAEACVSINGSMQHRLPGHLNLAFDGIDGETLLMSLRELAVSSGSACMSASMAPSYVLQAMGLSEAQAHSSLRFSFGRFTTQQDIDTAVTTVQQSLAALLPRRAM